MERVWLDVPYAQKDQAKSFGARWDSAAKRWYAPRPDMRELEPWSAQPPVPDLLPGEDRAFGAGLFVDLVPSSCWFTNVRSCVDQRDWERLRRMIVTRAGNQCEACGQGEDRSVGRWLEAHERWEYQQATRVQALRRLVCLCTWCHGATHFGLAQIKGTDGAARNHLRMITGMDERALEQHVSEAFAIWEHRNHTNWTLDLTILTSAGLRITPPPSATDRPDIAQRTLEDDE
ncbi:MAG TPA: DUF5710 domain-containing protein [Actinocrinis sp.]|uniref:DUF5710 domain-containing protein n=1 Tax=Actinocrinis sp. TaxID=1920516 RepID=UPI002DDD3D18|nr:DUF5710 domain-containing protein [Actinocrinis sp.]HEV2348155.1 DUF5710 domain-containing protein [Actinocrinis sp.]